MGKITADRASCCEVPEVKFQKGSAVGGHWPWYFLPDFSAQTWQDEWLARLPEPSVKLKLLLLCACVC